MMEELEDILKAMADEKRLRIIKLLEQRPLCVCEIAFVLGVTQPAVSKHLKKMREAGIIDSKQDGFWTNYYLKRENAYVKVLLRNVKGWLNDDLHVSRDLKKVKKADRSRLCCGTGIDKSK